MDFAESVRLNILELYEIECVYCELPLTDSEVIFELKKSFSLHKLIYRTCCLVCSRTGEIISDFHLKEAPIVNGQIRLKLKTPDLNEKDILNEALQILKTSAERKQQE